MRSDRDPSVRELLALDLHWARWRVERLKRRLAAAERSAELRLQEVARYEVAGIVPKRKGVQNALNDAVIGRAQRRGLVQKRGNA